jgi:uncharacterized protein HemX
MRIGAMSLLLLRHLALPSVLGIEMRRGRMARIAACIAVSVLFLLLALTENAAGEDPSPVPRPGTPTTPEAVATLVQTGINIGKANAEATSYVWGAAAGGGLALIALLAVFGFGYRGGREFAVDRQTAINNAGQKYDEEIRKARAEVQDARVKEAAANTRADETERREAHRQQDIRDRDREIRDLKAELDRARHIG